MAEAGRFLAVVPARGGSKRLPRKNVLPLAGRPLIAWTIDAARASGVFADVLVSTDDEEIAGVARQAGALVPWLRPAELATDTATSASVLKHAWAWYSRERGPVSAVVLLQPTSPFRTAASIRGAVEQFAAAPDAPAHPVVSVSPAAQPPHWSFRVDNGVLRPFLGWESLQVRSQDLPPAYALNGAVYVIPSADLAADLPVLRPGVRPFVMNDVREALDIDTADDWAAAEHVAERLAANPPDQPAH